MLIWHKRRYRFPLAGLGAMLLAIGLAASAMGAVVGTSGPSPQPDIAGSGTASVELTLTGTPTTSVTPTDLYLVIDESGSINSTEWNQLRSFATDIVNAVDTSGLFTNGGRVGVVRYSSGIRFEQPLTTNKSAVLGTINQPQQGGATHTGVAIRRAVDGFNAMSSPSNNRIMIVLTDGASTPGVTPSVSQAIATTPTDIVRFSVGIGGSINLAELQLIASDPNADHLFTPANFGELAGMLDTLMAAVTQPGATEIEVNATVASRFGPPSNVTASKGTAALSGQTVTWTIDELGTEADPNETATLTYEVPVSCTQGPGGVLVLHDAITYADAEGGTVAFDLVDVNLRGCVSAVDLEPETAENPVGTSHTVVATVSDDFGDPVAGATVNFEVISGPNAGTTATAVTDAAGEASFTISGTAVGTDEIVASAVNGASDTVTKDWVNLPPTAVANGPYSVDEGSSVTLDSAGSFDPEGGALTIAWDIDNDGTYETSGATASFAGADGNASATVGVEVCDPFGLCDSTTAEVMVLNVAPTVDAGTGQTTSRGGTVSLLGAFTDPAAAGDEPYAWSWDLDGDGTPDDSGTAAYGDSIPATTSFGTLGTFVLTLTVTDADGASATDTVTIDVVNQAPSCTTATASRTMIWPPNQQFHDVSVLGVTDPDGDAVSVTITGVMQDEPLLRSRGGQPLPDAQGVGTDTVQLRADRDGDGDGRVYHVSFTADDGLGGVCSGTVVVTVPHDRTGAPATDGGPLYDSTGS